MDKRFEKTFMAFKELRRYLTVLVIMVMKIKSQWDITIQLLEWLKLKRIKTNKILPDETKCWWGWSTTGISCIPSRAAKR